MYHKKITWGIGVVILFTLVAISLSGCLEQIDLDIPKGFQESVVIQGQLIKGDPSIVEVTVSRLFDFTVESLVERVNVREVLLIDESGQSLPLDVVQTGTYRLILDQSSPISVEAGKSYKISVSTFDGRQFESGMEPLLNVPEISQLTPQVLEKTFIRNETEERIDSFIEYRLNSELLAAGETEQSFLHWKVFGTYAITDSPLLSVDPEKTCYITENLDITQVKVLEGASQTSSLLEDFVVHESVIDYRYAEGYYLQVVQESLSEGAFNYLDQVRQSIDRDGSIFQAPAGKISSNIVNVNDPKDEVLGYFYATAHDTIRMFISPEFVGNPDTLCPPSIPPSGNPCPLVVCCDCSQEKNSEVNKPHFWKQ